MNFVSPSLLQHPGQRFTLSPHVKPVRGDSGFVKLHPYLIENAESANTLNLIIIKNLKERIDYLESLLRSHGVNITSDFTNAPASVTLSISKHHDAESTQYPMDLIHPRAIYTSLFEEDEPNISSIAESRNDENVENITPNWGTTTTIYQTNATKIVHSTESNQPHKRRRGPDKINRQQRNIVLEFEKKKGESANATVIANQLASTALAVAATAKISNNKNLPQDDVLGTNYEFECQPVMNASEVISNRSSNVGVSRKEMVSFKKLQPNVYATISSFDELFQNIKVNAQKAAMNGEEKRYILEIVEKTEHAYKTLFNAQSRVRPPGNILSPAKPVAFELLQILTRITADELGISNQLRLEGSKCMYDKLTSDFKPEHYVHLLDWHGGNLTLMQKIANLEVDKKGSRGTGVLSGSHQIQRVQAEIEYVFKRIIGGSLTDDGKGWAVDFDKCLGAWVCANVPPSCRELKLVATGDGLNSTGGKEQEIVCGFKFGHGIQVPLKGNAKKLLGSIHSVNQCMALAGASVRDTKENAIRYLGPFFLFCERIAKEGFLNPHNNQRYNVQMIFCMDMKAIVQGLGGSNEKIGGSFQQASHNWCCAATASSSLCGRPVRSDLRNCQICAPRGKTGNCRHVPMDIHCNTSALFTEQLDWNIPDPLPNASDKNQKAYCERVLKIHGITSETAARVAIANWKNQYFVTFDVAETTGYLRCDIERINKNLFIRFHDKPEQLREHIRQFIEEQLDDSLTAQESENLAKRNVLDFCNYVETFIRRRNKMRGDGHFFSSLDKFSICLLHAQMRIGEAMITHLAQACYNTHTAVEARRRCELFESTCKEVWTGVAHKESNFRIHVNGCTVERINLCRQRVKKLLNENRRDIWTNLVHLLLLREDNANDDIVQDWDGIGQTWISMMEIIDRDDDITENNCNIFQDICDHWGELLLKTIGPGKIGNYMHFFIAGHVWELLHRHGSIHRFTNQNWEALVGRLKADYRNSQYGGSCGGKNTNKVMPKAEATLRRWARRWMTAANQYQECVPNTWLYSEIHYMKSHLKLTYRSNVAKEFDERFRYGINYWNSEAVVHDTQARHSLNDYYDCHVIDLCEPCHYIPHDDINVLSEIFHTCLVHNSNDDNECE